MADYGLRIKNSASEIQIDSTYRNLSLHESNAAQTVSNANTDAGYYTTAAIASSPLVPIILIKPNTDYFVFMESYVLSAGNYTGVRLVTERLQTTVMGWACYRENIAPSAQVYGLRVYNPGGNLVFDSGRYYFKIRSVHTVSLGNPTAATFPYVDITHAATSDPFYILAPSSYSSNASPASGGTAVILKRVGLKKLSATSVRVGWFYLRSLFYGDIYVTSDEMYNPTLKLLVCN